MKLGGKNSAFLLQKKFSDLLGFHYSTRSIISSISLAILPIFYVYSLGSYLSPVIWTFVERTTYRTVFANTYVIDKPIDELIVIASASIWLLSSVNTSHKRVRLILPLSYILLATTFFFTSPLLMEYLSYLSFPLVLGLLIYQRADKNKKILKSDTSLLTVNYLSIIITSLALYSIFLLLTSIFFGTESTLLFTEGVPNYQNEIFLLFSSISHVILLLLIFSVPLIIFTREISPTLRVKITSLPLTAKYFKPYSLRSRLRVILLTIIILFSIFIVLVPKLGDHDVLVGADTLAYADWMESLRESESAIEFLAIAFQALGADRPLSLLFFYAILAFGDDGLVSSIDLLPVMLSPSLAIVIFFVTRELTRNDVVALFASFLTVVSAQVLAGTYGGFYSNWLGLIIGYLSILFLIRYGRIGSRLDILIFGGLIISLLFTHLYTWSIFCIVIGILLAVCLIKRFYPRKRTIILFSVLLLSIGIDLVKMTLTETSGGIERDIELAGRHDLWEQFDLRWNNLIRTSFSYVGGLLSNVIIFSLALYWAMTTRFHSVTPVLLIAFLSLGILPIFVGDVVVQTRVLYNIPFQIPAAITLGVISLTPRYRVITIPLVTWLIANSLNLSMNLNGPIPQL